MAKYVKRFCLFYLLILPLIADAFNLRSTKSCFTKHKCEDCRDLKVYAACRRYCRTFCAEWYIPAEEIPYVNNDLVETPAPVTQESHGNLEPAEFIPEDTGHFENSAERVVSFPRIKIPDSVRDFQAPPPPPRRVRPPPRARPFTTEPPYYETVTGPVGPLYYEEDTQQPYYEYTTERPATTKVWAPFGGDVNQILESLERLRPGPIERETPQFLTSPPSPPPAPTPAAVVAVKEEENILIPKTNLTAAQALAAAALVAAGAKEPNDTAIDQLKQAALLAASAGRRETQRKASNPDLLSFLQGPQTGERPAERPGRLIQRPRPGGSSQGSLFPRGLPRERQRPGERPGRLIGPGPRQRAPGRTRRPATRRLQPTTTTVAPQPKTPKKQANFKLKSTEPKIKVPAKSKLPPNERFLECCKNNPRVPEGCYSLCNFQNMNPQQAVAAYLFRGCGPQVRFELLSCGASGKDHRKCCGDHGAPQECLTYCNPDAQQGGGTSLTCLNIINPMKFCFETYMRFH